jgi:hypothetical protein
MATEPVFAGTVVKQELLATLFPAAVPFFFRKTNTEEDTDADVFCN